MTNEELAALSAKIAEGKANAQEIYLYNEACESFQKEQHSWHDMNADLVRMESASLEKFWRVQSRPRKAARIWRFRQVWTTAAAAVLLIAGLWFFLLQPSSPDAAQHRKSAENTHDIAPGRNTAVLTLADGQSIELSDQKTALVIEASALKYSDGEELNETSGKGFGMMRISTPRGGQYKVILPDSSEVWLNAASSLQFPASFAGLKQRNVSLTGEAYFEISKNKQQAFVVATKHQIIKVIGTHFNVSEYQNERARTTLLEGSVKVNDDILIPGQQADILSDGSAQIKSVDASEAIAWKNGKFSFEREEIGSIMKKVERWYDVEIDYQDDVRSIRLTGSVSRFENVSKLLSMLENTKEVHFKMEGRKIIVTK